MQRNVKPSLFIACVLAAFGAQAQEATPDTFSQAVSTLSRAQVQQQLAAARADGTVNAVSATYDFARRSVATKSRAQVYAELLQARAAGELAAIDGQAHDFRAAPRQTIYAQR